MTSLVSDQFQQATVDFYSSLGEGEMVVASQVGAAMRAMLDDCVLDSVEAEIAQDCLSKLGKASMDALERECAKKARLKNCSMPFDHSDPKLPDLVKITDLARACAVAGEPFDVKAADHLSSIVTALVEATGNFCVSALKKGSERQVSSAIGSAEASATGSIVHRHLHYVQQIFSDTAGHINALSTLGFRPAVVLHAIAPVCNSCVAYANTVLGLFKDSSRLDDWERFVQSGGPPPRRARKAGLLVQEVIDPILNEASSLCKEFWRFNTFANDIVANIKAIATSTDSLATGHKETARVEAIGADWKEAVPASDSLRRVQVAAQEMVVGYMMIERYCISRNVEKAVEIAVITQDGYAGEATNSGDASGNEITSGKNDGIAIIDNTLNTPNVLSHANHFKSPTLSLIGESFFILKLRFSRALNTLHVDAARFILNHLQAVLEEVVLVEVKLLLDCRSSIGLGHISVLDTLVAKPSAALRLQGDLFSDSHTVGANTQLTENFNATLDQMLDSEGIGKGIGKGASVAGSDGQGRDHYLKRAAVQRSRYPLASLVVAACSAREANALCKSFASFVELQFEGAFGIENLGSIGPMLENLAGTGNSFALMRDSALDSLAERMEAGVKRMLESETKLLEVEYELTSEEFRMRQVNDLFAKKLVAYLDSDKCMLYHCRKNMSSEDSMLLVRAVAKRLASIICKVWLQMRVNSLGGLMMQNDLRILIDGLGAFMDSGSVRSEFSRLSALCWLVNLDSPDELTEQTTLIASIQTLSGLDLDDICNMLALRVEFERQPDKIKSAVHRFLELRCD